MYRVTPLSVPEVTQKKASLNQRIREAEGTRARNVREAKHQTLQTLRAKLFFCPDLAPDQLATRPSRDRGPAKG